MKKILFILNLFMVGQLFAWEKIYDFNSLAQMYSHYSIINSSSGDGLIVSGNAKNTGAFKAHAMKLDYSGNVMWSNTYSFSSSWNTWTYRIASDNNSGYLMTGMNVKGGSPNVFNPYVIRINAAGNAVQKVLLPCNGVGLTIRACANGNIIVGGFESETFSDYASYTRKGFLCKLDANLNLIWYKQITGQQVSGYYNFDHVEVVVPIMKNGSEYYYVSGAITKDISIPGVTQTTNVMLSQLYDASGNLAWNNSQLEDFNGVDAVYNPDNNEIFLIANGDVSTPDVSNFYRMDANTGSITKTATYEGSTGNTPYGCHITYANKINYINNKVIIYGYSRDIKYMTLYNNMYIPFRIETDRDFNMPNIKLFLYKTTNYAQGNLLGANGNGVFNSFHTADMGVDFSINGINHFALVGYDRDQTYLPFALHVSMDSDLDDCTPRSTAIVYQDFYDFPNLFVGHLNISKPNPPPVIPITTPVSFTVRDCFRRSDGDFEMRLGISNTDQSPLENTILLNFNKQQLGFNMRESGDASYQLDIYDQAGRKVTTLDIGDSNQLIQYDLIPGVYVAVLRSGEFQSTSKFIQQ